MNWVMFVDFLFEFIVEILGVVLEPIFNHITKENRKIKNITLRKIAKVIVVVLCFLVVFVIYTILSKLIRGYWF